MLINDNGFLRFRHEDDPHDKVTDLDNEQPANETIRSFPDKSRCYSGGGMGDILEAGEKRETSPSLSMPDGYDSDRKKTDRALARSKVI